ncbi:uncharacterized protein LOC120173575 [Hibiscus syriacus]|uniref:uncharacterized protein LOC120173575 n=1 Tax=Hibiscus syriacus TaxID=106335 RepID=UPI0019217D11|nr:uncharacterized protein LOC120173575 [Hibiscus syriacus]
MVNQKDRVCIPNDEELRGKQDVPRSERAFLVAIHEKNRDRVCVKVSYLSISETEHQVPSGLLQPIYIPQWKLERVTMDLVTGLPLTPGKKDSIWVVVDRLTKTTHLLLVRTDYSMDKYATLYLKEIV